MISRGGGRKKGGAEPKQETADCPMCGAKVPKDAEECPRCEEPFGPEAFVKVKETRGTKFLFWMGLLLALGGGGVAMGSWIYDLMGWGSDGFGWLNRFVALIGIIILVIGIIFLILSLSKMEKQDLREMELSEEKEEQGG